LLVDRETIRDILADAMTRSVEEFLAYVDCTVTFEEIARALLIPLERCVPRCCLSVLIFISCRQRHSCCCWCDCDWRCCTHSADKIAIQLSSWGVARIMKTVTMQSVYKVQPGANLSPNTAEAKAFASEFPGSSLPETLSYFTGT